MIKDELKNEFIILKDENESCNSIDTFKSLLNSHASFKITAKEFKHNGFRMSYELSTNTLQNGSKTERYFNLTLIRKSETDADKEKDIPEINNALKDLRMVLNNFGNGLRLIKLWDDISVYQSEKAYPLLHEIENLMRQLIMKFMLTKLGTSWLNVAVPQTTKKAIEDNAKRNKTLNIVEAGIFEADFIDLADFLFKEYSTFKENDFFKAIRSAKPEDTLDVSKYKNELPKSNWDRYFNDLIEIKELNKKWKRLYDLRNLIAHNRHLTTKQFEEIKELTSEMGQKLLEGISKIGQLSPDKLKSENEANEGKAAPQVEARDASADVQVSLFDLNSHLKWMTASLLSGSFGKASGSYHRKTRLIESEPHEWDPEYDNPIEAMQRIMLNATWDFDAKMVLISGDGDYVNPVSSLEELVNTLDNAAIDHMHGEMPMFWLKENTPLDYSGEAWEFIKENHEVELRAMGWHGEYDEEGI